MPEAVLGPPKARLSRRSPLCSALHSGSSVVGVGRSDGRRQAAEHEAVRGQAMERSRTLDVG